ncbi:MAG: hypothetical protein GX913_04320 [Clostridiales bacterium]|nr:hypothetical protein [Clostridiales bacterium]
MKEKLYSIPVNDAFHTECECPICEMEKTLELNSVEYIMGASYMEDDIRMETDRMGFCVNHMHMVWEQNNKLGLALVLKSHMEKTTKDIKKLLESSQKKAGFSRKPKENPVTSYIDKLESSCFVCERTNRIFERYISTIYHLWKEDKEFKKSYNSSKGFCTKHYGELIKHAPSNLNGVLLEEFIKDTHKLYLENMERIISDVEWFVDKFDYRYKDEPWKNSKDALPRALTKVNQIISLGEDN